MAIMKKEKTINTEDNHLRGLLYFIAVEIIIAITPMVIYGLMLLAEKYIGRTNFFTALLHIILLIMLAASFIFCTFWLVASYWSGSAIYDVAEEFNKRGKGNFATRFITSENILVTAVKILASYGMVRLVIDATPVIIRIVKHLNKGFMTNIYSGILPLIPIVFYSTIEFFLLAALKAPALQVYYFLTAPSRAKREREAQAMEELRKARMKEESERYALMEQQAEMAFFERMRDLTWEFVCKWEIGLTKQQSDLLVEYTKGRWRKYIEEGTPEKLLSVPGITQNRLNKIVSCYQHQNDVRAKRDDTDLTIEQEAALAESEVDYRLKWWVAKNPEYKLIQKDCQSEYSSACIRIANWQLIPEPQEIDHLLVGPAGIIHIETKNYSGVIDVHDNYVWRRDIQNNGKWEKHESPAFQVSRHETLLTSIVGADVPVHGVICMANENVIVQNKERSSYPIIGIFHIEEELNRLTKMHGAKLDSQAVNEIVAKLEKSKVHRAKNHHEGEGSAPDNGTQPSEQVVQG